MIDQRHSNISFFRVRRVCIGLVILFTLCFWWMAMNYLFDDVSFGKYFPLAKLHKNFTFVWIPKNMGLNRESDGLTVGVDFEKEYASLTCKFARLDPWDPTIIDKIYHPRDISCTQRQGNLTFVDYDGYLNLNVTAVKQYYSSNPQILDTINCTYATFDRDPLQHNDRTITKITKGPLLPGVPVKLDSDMVEAACYDENGTEIYFNMHAHPCIACKNKTFAQWKPGNLSVLMLMLDSTSTSVLKRHLTKTYDYIKNVMKFKIFNGHSKVGDNSFPNMIGALTGYRYQYEQKDMPPDTLEDVSKIQFDHWPLAWKFFQRKGYATVFNEDKAEWGLFHYMARGFKDKPVDFFYHSYWYNIYLREYYSKVFDNYCFRNSPKVERLLDIAKRHLVTMRDFLQFQYVFLTDLCHEYHGSEEERADEYVYNFFKSLFEKGYFDRTAILFFSDHGHRYTPIRSTLVGLLEERTPMFNIWFPPWFYAKYPHIERNLEINAVRLSSSFDIYQTLQDLASGNFRGEQRAYGSRGYSQLYPIPINRTCFQAGVPDHHCTCVSMTPLDVQGDARVEKLADSLVSYLNHRLEPYSNICSNFTLGRVLRAEQLNVNEKLALGVKNYQVAPQTTTTTSSETAAETTAENSAPGATTEAQLRPMNQVRVALEAQPMAAQFEAVLEYSADNDSYAVTSDVSRLNAYGPQSFCAQKKFLEKLCVCREYLNSLEKQQITTTAS